MLVDDEGRKRVSSRRLMQDRHQIVHPIFSVPLARGDNREQAQSCFHASVGASAPAAHARGPAMKCLLVQAEMETVRDFRFLF